MEVKFLESEEDVQEICYYRFSLKINDIKDDCPGIYHIWLLMNEDARNRMEYDFSLN